MSRIYSDYICFEDLRRAYNVREYLNELTNGWLSKLPYEEGVKIVWVNQTNTDVDSKDYNPFGILGRFLFTKADDKEPECTPMHPKQQDFMQKEAVALMDRYKKLHTPPTKQP